jgi:large subunit ribosomal protein L11
MNFCKEYNTRTKDKGDLITPVEISAYEDRRFSFILKTSPASILLKKVVNINKCSS